MKKTLWKSLVFVLVFILSVVIAEKIMNKGHENLTMEIAPATFPLVIIERGGVGYNELHGYRRPMDVTFQRENRIVLETDRTLEFSVETYGVSIDEINVEVRSADGKRLIERIRQETEADTETGASGRLHGKLQVKDLIEKDTEYLMVFLVKSGGQVIRYYGSLYWSDDLKLDEKLAFVRDFHERLFDKEAAREIAKYLEPDEKLEENRSFYKVNIHSSFRQITYGNLNAKQESQPVINLREISDTSAIFSVDYLVSTPKSNGESIYYQTEEVYRVWYSSQVQYLLDYERTMSQIPEADTMYANDKILLGITDWEIPLRENQDGSVVAFADSGRLWSYHAQTDSLVAVFGPGADQKYDRREMYNQYDIRILDVEENGSIDFAVYGYMNTGRHEGEVGIQLYTYDAVMNTIEENVYIPYEKGFKILKTEIDRLLYLNRERKLFLQLEGIVYSIDLTDRNQTVLTHTKLDSEMFVSQNNRILLSLGAREADEIYHCEEMFVFNLSNETMQTITADAGETLLPLGFMDEDILYGVARNEDVTVEYTGLVFFPMYKLCISDYNGNILKEYRQEDVYITGCTVEDNQITIERVRKTEKGEYKPMEADHITNNKESIPGKNEVVTADIDTYERYVQIRVRTRIDEKKIKLLTPKEVAFEGGRTLELDYEDEERYYVYGLRGVEKVTDSAAMAVQRADEISGYVVDKEGRTIWKTASRLSKNQIMAITQEPVTEEKGSIAVCLDVILKLEGMAGSTAKLLEQGKSAEWILESYLDECTVLNLTGCSLDEVLYYVNQDIPVMALLNDYEAVLITGFNAREIVIMEPSTGRLYKKGINATIEWLKQNHNCFITYSRLEQ